jgi:ribosome modulation factor
MYGQAAVINHSEVNQSWQGPLMKPKKGTAAHRAHEAGLNAYAQGKMLEDCPYTTRANMSLKHWYEKGFNDLKEEMQ